MNLLAYRGCALISTFIPLIFLRFHRFCLYSADLASIFRATKKRNWAAQGDGLPSLVFDSGGPAGVAPVALSAHLAGAAGGQRQLDLIAVGALPQKYVPSCECYILLACIHGVYQEIAWICWLKILI